VSRVRTGEELCTVEFAAERLKLHPKTVLRFIRAGKLRASRPGKAYRILRSDLEAFAGVPDAAPQAVPDARVTCIVDVPDVGPQLAQKWQRAVPAALQARSAGSIPLRVDIVYEPERSHLKIVAVGDPGDVLYLLSLIRVWLEQL
jgi:excisionase family DNA binding protein